MKKLAIVALCFFSSFSSAKDIEEVVVKARQVELVIAKLSENHKQNPVTGNWHYVEEKKEERNTQERGIILSLLRERDLLR
jgi:hypothetical protein